MTSLQHDITSTSHHFNITSTSHHIASHQHHISISSSSTPASQANNSKLTKVGFPSFRLNSAATTSDRPASQGIQPFLRTISILIIESPPADSQGYSPHTAAQGMLRVRIKEPEPWFSPEATFAIKVVRRRKGPISSPPPY